MFSVSFRTAFSLVLTLLLVAKAPSVRAADEKTVASLLAQGEAEDAHDRLSSALTAFLEAEKIAPNQPDVLLRIARQYSSLVDATNVPSEAKDFAEKSLSYAKRALDLLPESAKAHLTIAIAYGKLTDFTSNRTKLEYSRIIKAETVKSIALDPTDDYAYHVLGRWHAGVANLNPMLRMLAKAVYGSMPEASNAEAIRYFKKAIELAPNRLMHRVELAKVYEIAHEKQLALKEWQTALRLPAEDAEDRKMLQEARDALRK